MIMSRNLKYILIVGLISVIGLLIYFYAIKQDKPAPENHQKEIYTCSMHPQIIRNQPGNCPICGMTLVKKIMQNHALVSDTIGNITQPTDNFIVGNYQTTNPKDTVISSEINLPGVVAYDPTSSVNIAARISGRIERMYVNYKYQQINKGQRLFDLYSPELLTEQQNFIYLVTNDPDNGAIINAAKQKLLLYGMTRSQINHLAATKKARPVVSIFSPTNGIAQSTETMPQNSGTAMQNDNTNAALLTIKEGDYIKKGDVVFSLSNTDKVWGIFNVSQGSNSLIKTGQSIRIATESDEKKFIDAQIDFIEPQFSPEEKTSRIRVYLNNRNLKLPVGLRLQGIVKTNPVKGIWVENQALVSIGNKKIVFIKMKNGFKVREVKTGQQMNDFTQITAGIDIEDNIAKNAQYLVDSESFIKTE